MINQSWKIDLNQRTATNSVVGVIMQYDNRDDKISNWTVIEGNPSEQDFDEATRIYEHEYSKPFIKHFKEKLNFSLKEIAEVSSLHSSEKGYGVNFSEAYLNNCMKDEDFLTIKNISIIRAAIYFYRKTRGSD